MSTRQPYATGTWEHVDTSTLQDDMTARTIEREVEQAEYRYNMREVSIGFGTLFADAAAKYRAEDANRLRLRNDLADIANRYGFDPATGEFILAQLPALPVWPNPLLSR